MLDLCFLFFVLQAIWIENSVVQEIDIPKNICSTFTSNFPLTAEHWVSMLSQNLKRRRSKVVTSEMFDEIHGMVYALIFQVHDCSLNIVHR